MKNLAHHLREGGLLLLNRQKPYDNDEKHRSEYGNYDKHLPEGIVYSQFIEAKENTIDYHTLEKSYFFKKDGEIVAQEKLTLTYFKPEAYQQLLSDAGFDFQDTNNGDILAVYKKR